MSKINDLTGRIFGRLTVIKYQGSNSHGKATWLCLCECKREVVIEGTSLVHGNPKSCGCRKEGKVVDLTGRKFGRLTVVERNGSNSAKNSMWLCICDCGKEKITSGNNLQTGNTRSCGCLHSGSSSKKFTTHGLSKHPLHNTWKGIIQRCTNKNNPSWKNYGGRQIAICDRWRHSFDNFLADMGEKPRKEYSIDRIDNNGNYSCGHCEECIKNGWSANCRWASQSEQCLNKRISKKNKQSI